MSITSSRSTTAAAISPATRSWSRWPKSSRESSGRRTRPAAWAGTKFAILLPHTDEHRARTVASRIVLAVRALRPEHGHPRVPISVSVGISAITNKTDHVEAARPQQTARCTTRSAAAATARRSALKTRRPTPAPISRGSTPALATAPAKPKSSSGALVPVRTPSPPCFSDRRSPPCSDAAPRDHDPGKCIQEAHRRLLKERQLQIPRHRHPGEGVVRSLAHRWPSSSRGRHATTSKQRCNRGQTNRWRRTPRRPRSGSSRAAAKAIRATGATGLEPATSGVTGRRSNQLSYAPLGTNLVYAKRLSSGGVLMVERRSTRSGSPAHKYAAVPLEWLRDICRNPDVVLMPAAIDAGGR